MLLEFVKQLENIFLSFCNLNKLISHKVYAKKQVRIGLIDYW